MDFYEGSDIELGPKGDGRFDRQRRERGGGLFRREQTVKTKVWGPGYPTGAGLWDTLGAPWGWVGEIRQPW